MSSFDIIPDPKLVQQSTNFYRHTWVENFEMKVPQDWGLAIEKGIEVPQYITELWARFYKLDYIWKYGGRCVFMSNLLKKILRLHGYEAHTRQVILTWEHPDRPSWGCQVGASGVTGSRDELDVHQVCVVGDYILDWSVIPVTWNRCGVQSPLGFVAKMGNGSYFEKLHDFEQYGLAGWMPRRPKNDFVKHWRLEMDDELRQEIKSYFQIYKMERHDARRDFND